jgi:hypothetical protein
MAMMPSGEAKRYLPKIYCRQARLQAEGEFLDTPDAARMRNDTDYRNTIKAGLQQKAGPGLHFSDLFCLLEAGHVAYGATGFVQALALPAKGFATRPLADVLGVHAVAGLAVGVVVVDLRVGRIPGTLAPQGTGGLPHRVLGCAYDPFTLVCGHDFPPPVAK